MDVTTRRLLVLVALFAGTAVLAVAFEAAGERVALGVAIAALAVLVLSYARLAVRAWRWYDERDEERVRAAARQHLPVLVAVPFVVTAAHPWGPASPAVGFGAAILCQFLFMHVQLIVAAAVRGTRGQRRPPRASG